MATSALLMAPARAAASLLVHAAPLLLLLRLFTALRITLAALTCRMEVRRRRLGPLVCLYQNVVGGYHPNCDSEEAWEGVRAAAAAAAPRVHWTALPTFRLTFDGPFSKPFGDTCRSSVGFVVAQGCPDPEGVVAAWRAHPVASPATPTPRRLSPDYLPRGEYLAVEMPYCGYLSHCIALGRLLLWSWCLKGTAVALPVGEGAWAHPEAKVPGFLQICDPGTHTLTLAVALEGRDTMLPF